MTVVAAHHGKDHTGCETDAEYRTQNPKGNRGHHRARPAAASVAQFSHQVQYSMAAGWLGSLELFADLFGAQLLEEAGEEVACVVDQNIN